MMNQISFKDMTSKEALKQLHKTESMNIITDKTKAPAKLRYRVSNNSGTINEESGKDHKPLMILQTE